MTDLEMYNDKLVLLSIFIAIISSYASFDIFSRISSAKGNGKIFWLITGSYILGLGIWTTHFIGMLSYDIHIPVTYSIKLNALSLLIAIVATMISFYYVNNSEKKLYTICLSSLILGSGMIAMHYIGMKSMHTDVIFSYHPLFIIFSIILAILTSGLAFVLFFYIKSNNKLMKKLFTAIIMGIGIACIHYTAMKAITLSEMPVIHGVNQIIQFDQSTYRISTEGLGYGLAISMTIIVVTIISLAYFDRDKAERLQKLTKAHYKSIIEHNPSLVFTVDNTGIIQSVNPKGMEILKQQREQIISKSIFSFFNIEGKEKIEEEFKKLSLIKRKDFSASIQNGEGNWIPMFISLVPIIVDEKMSGIFVIARDISDLMDSKEHIKKAQRELIETMRKQQGLIFKYVKVGDRYIHTLCDGQLLYKMGYTPKMVLGKDFRDYLPEQEVLVNLQAYTEAWEGKITNYEVNISGFDVYVCLTPVIENEKVIEVIGSGVDITDRKKAEQITKKNEEWFRNVLNMMSEGVMVYGADGQVIDLNDNSYKIFGVGETEFRKQTLFEYDYPLIREDRSPLLIEELPAYITLKTGRTIKGEVIGAKVDTGKTHWFSVNTKLLNPQEKEEHQQVLLTMFDITHQKEQELSLKESHALRRTIIDNLPMGILYTDINRKIASLNRPFCQMFNIEEPLKSLIGKSTTNYNKYFYSNRENDEDTILEIIENKQAVSDEIEINDGRMIKRSFFPFYMDGVLKGHLWTFEDITERKITEKEIIKAKEEAIQANLAKSEFLSKMSHELRTPLNGILGFSQLLEIDQTLDSHQQKFVQEILKGGRHLLNLINEVLDLSRIETGNLQITNNKVKLGRIIDDCINLLEPSANKNGIQMKWEQYCSDNYVSIDEIRFRQILLNLMENAIKYNKENGEIKVRCVQKDDSVIIHVIDNGVGIPKEEQSRIFEPFYRLDHSHVDGTGIGLSLVKQLVQLMGGELGLNSEIGRGSDFWFRLPTESLNAGDTREIRVDKYESSIGDENYQILYIEDNPSNLELVSEIIGVENGITLHSAETGLEGLQLASIRELDLILLDIHLPDMTGFEVLDQLKENPFTNHIPVIALSANAMPEDIHEALAKGFKEYITKPLHVPSFLQTISKYL